MDPTSLYPHHPHRLLPPHAALPLLLRRHTHLSLRHLLQIQTLLLTNPPLPSARLISFNTLLKSFSHHRLYPHSLLCFRHHLLSSPDAYTFTSVIKSCSALLSFSSASQTHALVLKLGFLCNLCVSNSLVDAYFKLGLPHLARRLFDEMRVRDVVSWNTIVSGLCSIGDVKNARRVFEGMKERSLVSWSAMIAGLARSGDVDGARGVFDSMPEKGLGVGPWNAMISAYAQSERFGEAVGLFRGLQREGLRPNDVTLLSVLSACSHLGALELGRQRFGADYQCRALDPSKSSIFFEKNRIPGGFM
ncbi:Pentatricopeptide repeat-containing protein [Acorus calamus]|uniref:Pentatricopeptide repeat-containing protein n=1 Tax=Acorus calamus TaxID=4465 RepID=A0AAV9FKE9_ACOCL|nr:Pentatricopeptide repeat-containing protein [Acorus calamus]